MTIAAKLDKKARADLPEGEFAVPGKRKLPINDERHTRLAWDMVERTQGLTLAEQAEARRRILRKAKELGIDASDWHKVAAMSFEGAIEAMAIDIPDDDHPNRMPFSGVLVRLDQPSDAAPHGTNGRKINVTAEAAERALSSLLGMAVDYTPSFDGHDAKRKIGIITSADIVGNAIEIKGFIYAADFPEEAVQIKAMKSVLGFSIEAQRLVIEDPSAEILTITDLAFTGAAILRKDKAAYRSTSLAASAAQETPDMTPEELKALFNEAISPLAARLDKIEAAAKTPVRIDASAIRDVVEPHAQACEAAADAMEAAGIGTHPSSGHAAVLRRIAGSLRAESAMGRLPTIHRDHDWPVYAGAAQTAPQAQPDADAITKAVEAAVKPLKDELASTGTKIEDLKASAFKASPAPDRKSLHPQITALLAKAGAAAPEDGKFTENMVADLLDKAKVTDPVTRIALKRAAGI